MERPESRDNFHLRVSLNKKNIQIMLFLSVCLQLEPIAVQQSSCMAITQQYFNFETVFRNRLFLDEGNVSRVSYQTSCLFIFRFTKEEQ